AAYGGFIFPDLILSGMVEERQTFIRRLLPDAIDILVVGVESGLGFERAIRLYTERFSGALSEEFSKALAEIDLGRTRRRALTDLATRNQLRELNLFVSAVLQAEKLGTPLAVILAIQSEEARSRHRQWVQEVSAKAPIKILFPLAGLILPALFGVLIGPVVIKMLAGG
ncbi:MAG TPA: type II secretion system F family protein, partial [Actinobacteria bacterium]|nr:type II secretion system F family protein [Actinomycetes bacterium]HEX21580.1 type II secretion system F family protein [Actinomycetota bacterium]